MTAFFFLGEISKKKKEKICASSGAAEPAV
jgi:hypothetical protein